MGGTEIKNEDALAAILFMQASTMTMDVYSALNSSPWTSENFGADPEKAKSCRYYVYHSMVVTLFYGGLGTIISKRWWPLLGTILADGYMYYLYERALKKGAVSGSSGWAKGDGKS